MKHKLIMIDHHNPRTVYRKYGLEGMLLDRLSNIFYPITAGIAHCDDTEIKDRAVQAMGIYEEVIKCVREHFKDLPTDEVIKENVDRFEQAVIMKTLSWNRDDATIEHDDVEHRQAKQGLDSVIRLLKR